MSLVSVSSEKERLLSRGFDRTARFDCRSYCRHSHTSVKQIIFSQFFSSFDSGGLTKHLMTGPSGNSEFCFLSASPRKTLRSWGNKTHCFLRGQSLLFWRGRGGGGSSKKKDHCKGGGACEKNGKLRGGHVILNGASQIPPAPLPHKK